MSEPKCMYDDRHIYIYIYHTVALDGTILFVPDMIGEIHVICKSCYAYDVYNLRFPILDEAWVDSYI